jgi:hypothetical protein
MVVGWVKNGVPLTPNKVFLSELSDVPRRNKIVVDEEMEWTRGEIKRLVGSGALKEVPQSLLMKVSPIRLAPRKGPKKVQADCQHEENQQVLATEIL